MARKKVPPSPEPDRLDPIVVLCAVCNCFDFLSSSDGERSG
jgi:hypothetical protein